MDTLTYARLTYTTCLSGGMQESGWSRSSSRLLQRGAGTHQGHSHWPPQIWVC